MTSPWPDLSNGPPTIPGDSGGTLFELSWRVGDNGDHLPTVLYRSGLFRSGLHRNGLDRTGHVVASVPLPLRGLRLRYNASADRVCLGHRPSGGTYQECRSAPTEGKRRCEHCQSREALLASQLHHAHTRDRSSLSAAMSEHLRRTNVLYLATFRDGSLKVGTSTASRVKTRLTEQGAWLATVVAEADDGFVVRELEDHVTEFLGVGQSVSASRKVDGMVNPVEDQQLRRIIAGNAARVHTMVRRLDDPRLRPTEAAWSHVATTNPLWSKVFAYPLDLTSGQHDIVIDDACGRVIAFRRPERGEDVFVADLGPLLGAVLEPGDETAAPEIAVQDSLF